MPSARVAGDLLRVFRYCFTSRDSTCAKRHYKDRHRYLAQCLLPSQHVQLVPRP